MPFRRYTILSAVLFTTGAAILALELVSSRILTPIFGASLYVWTGILSVTLACLAAGYSLGGRWSRLPRESVAQRYAALPLMAAVHVMVADAFHPFLLPGFAAIDVILGALLGCVFLLGPALVALSAMNPLLSVLMRGDRAGDGGGKAFTISTAGSVAGVFLTSLVLVPRFAVSDILLILAFALGACGLLATETAVAPGQQRRRLRLGTAALAAALLGLWALPTAGTARIGHLVLEREAAYRSPYGDILVVKAAAPGMDPLRLYIQNGGLQGGLDRQGRSVVGYTEMVAHALREARPQAQRVLVVGLGAGILPRDLAAQGIDVTVIDIDPNSVTAAEHHFGLVPDDLAIRIGDARILLEGCARLGTAYDAIILDAFSGIDLPEHLLTLEAFRDVGRCIAPDGIVLANFILPAPEVRVTRAVLGTMAEAFGGNLILYRKDWRADPERFSTLVVLARSGWETAPSLTIADFPTTLGVRRPTTVEGRTIDRQDLAGAELITDRHNRFSWLAAAGQAAARREIAVALPGNW